MIIAVLQKKHWIKCNHPLLVKIKIPSKLGIEGNFFNVTKDIYDLSAANLILNGKGLNAFFLRSGTKQECLFFHSTHTSASTHCRKTIQRIKELDMVLLACSPSFSRSWQEDHLRLGVQVQPGQRRPHLTCLSTKKEKGNKAKMDKCNYKWDYINLKAPAQQTLWTE